MLQNVLNFCEQYRNNQPQYPRPVGQTIDDMWRNIWSTIPLGHLPLPSIKVPVEELLHEIKTLKFTAHPPADRYAGRNVFVIYGTAEDKLPLNPVHDNVTKEDEIAYFTQGQWLNRELAPIITAYFENTFPVEKYNHIVLMLLEPGGWIDAHVDSFVSSSKTINIPLTLPTNSMACNTQGEIPYVVGEPLWFNTSIEHAIHNSSNEDRYMISVGVNEYTPEFKKEIMRSYLEQRKRSLQASR